MEMKKRPIFEPQHKIVDRRDVNITDIEDVVSTYNILKEGCPGAHHISLELDVFDDMVETAEIIVYVSNPLRNQYLKDLEEYEKWYEGNEEKIKLIRDNTLLQIKAHQEKINELRKTLI